MRAWNNRSLIYIMAIIPKKMHESWEGNKVVRVLFIVLKMLLTMTLESN